MADVILALGGPYRYNLNTLAQNTVYDDKVDGGACRIADEYHHGFYTWGNSFNPMFSTGQIEALDKHKVGVGDFIGLFEIPPHHTVVDTAVLVSPVQSDRGFVGPNNSDGLVFDVEIRKYSRETLEQTGTVDLATPITGLPANVATHKRSPIEAATMGYYVEPGEMLIAGLKVVSLPSGEDVKLSDVTCRIELTGHAWDYEAPLHV